jgi:hypothetical protein
MPVVELIPKPAPTVGVPTVNPTWPVRTVGG